MMALSRSFAYNLLLFNIERYSNMQDINPITNKIADLRGRMESLRGYL